VGSRDFWSSDSGDDGGGSGGGGSGEWFGERRGKRGGEREIIVVFESVIHRGQKSRGCDEAVEQEW